MMKNISLADKLINILELIKTAILLFFTFIVCLWCICVQIVALLFHGHIRTVVVITALLTACSTYTPRTCEQKAWEAAGNAMSNTQYNLDEKMEWDKRVNCANGCLNTPIVDSVDTGQANGPDSQTGYRGQSSREAYDAAIKQCAGQASIK